MIKNYALTVLYYYMLGNILYRVYMNKIIHENFYILRMPRMATLIKRNELSSTRRYAAKCLFCNHKT